jgi:hypothetical protein
VPIGGSLDAIKQLQVKLGIELLTELQDVAKL